MNSFSILEELNKVIEDCISDSIAIENVKLVCFEVERVLNNDFILKKHFSSETIFTVAMCKLFSNQPDSKKLNQLSANTKILRNILKVHYKNKILSTLQAKFNNVEKVKDISYLTNTLGTYLLWEGYSYKYLYEQKKLFLNADYDSSFTTRFEKFIKNISVAQKTLTVYVKFTALKDLVKMDDVFGINVSDEPIKEKSKNDTLRLFNEQSGTLICSISEITALDYISAIQIAFDKLSILRNLVRYEFRKTTFKISPKILVKDNRTSQFLIGHSDQRQIGFISSGSMRKFRLYSKNFSKAISQDIKKLDGSSREKLNNSFHFFRLGLDADSIESKFLHSWIALEYLLKSGEHRSIIGTVQQFLPKVVANKYFSKILKNLSAEISRLKISESILNNHSLNKKDKHILLNNLYTLLSNSDKTKKFCKEIHNPLLVERINQISEMFSNNDELKKNFKHHFNDLKWNLQRIYRVRNKIIHSAKTSLNILQLESNLSNYYSILFEVILYEASHSSSKTTIENILQDEASKYDFLEHSLSVKKFNLDLLLS